ncbi:hypothetical protein NM208_g16934 [Fusarium decemcellulare]|uniref:Uncharacterized protein n=1 Tax=Fusarium decemcellulare TaxID=57161 RepID=A0ACC1RC64_9HYPO|nr:hypothetical protein NM208_g16934 [Fusarium decemcellulare]
MLNNWKEGVGPKLDDEFGDSLKAAAGDGVNGFDPFKDDLGLDYPQKMNTLLVVTKDGVQRCLLGQYTDQTWLAISSSCTERVCRHH